MVSDHPFGAHGGQHEVALLVYFFHGLLSSHREQATEMYSKRHWIHIYRESERPPQGLVLKYMKVLKPNLVYVASPGGRVSSSLKRCGLI